MLVTTTPSFEGKRITNYLGLVSGEAILGANIFRDLFAGIRDIVGGRSAAYESELRKAKEIAIREMQDQASALGANAVVGVDLDYETVGGGTMLMVSASAYGCRLRVTTTAQRVRAPTTGFPPRRALRDGEDAFEVVGRARDDVHADEFADAAGGRSAGVGRGLHRADIAPDDGGDQAGIDLLPADEHDIGGLAHRVGGFDHADESACFDHPECVAGKFLLGHVRPESISIRAR